MDYWRLLILLIVAGAIQANRAPRAAAGFDCINKPDGDYADPMSQCSTIFYKCSPTGMTILSCPAGTAYDIQLRTCNWFNAIAECKGQPIPLSSSATQTSTTPATTIIPTTTVQANPIQLPSALISFSCNQNPSAANASLFFDCFQIPNLRASLLAFDCIQKPGSKLGEPALFDCFQKTINGGTGGAIALQCSHLSAEDEAFKCTQASGLAGFGFECRVSGARNDPQQPLAFGCVHNSARATATTTVRTTTPMADVPQFDCVGKPSGNYPMGACENHFWQCSNNVAFKMPCATLQQRYNPINDRCLDPVDVPGCRVAARRRREIATFVSCSGKLDGDYATGLCQAAFYTCSNNQATLTNCSAGTVFDSQLKRCQWVDKVDECKPDSTTLATSVQADETTPLVTSFTCDGKESGDYANPDLRCSKYFFKCVAGKMTQAWCPADLIFDPDYLVCNYRDNIEC